MCFLFSAFCFLIISFASLTASAPLAARDVYIPHITAPTSNTVWRCGQNVTVAWDSSNRPKDVTNSEGMVLLRKEGLEDAEHPLASGFNVVDLHSMSFKVPRVPPRDDYQIVLFGDSGNFSPKFTIECDSDSA
ncbi:hypothetical protein F5879DRAFT_478293 [Lentinula edodes]|uniref:uncharacterized protein n=1 Tax=Lentinula edodes TaxID=5353 RepID=UPI001E8CD725|nr:uncharacterized protein C8R40DRAFT_616849 [Lentinula edodes]KAH7870927.1 hypothetical protein C8R40DRAFT_616849 [Lentinula edodes]KAJ3899746.1 hypothetical protein F5879DRAFT_478293 [Lentinula edodes]